MVHHHKPTRQPAALQTTRPSKNKPGFSIFGAAFIAVALGMSVSGCAFTTDYVTISHNTRGAVAVPGASEIPVNVQVVDQRSDTMKVSAKKNGYGMECAAILAREDVAATVRQAINQELKSRGFKIQEEMLDVTRVNVDIFRFYNDYKVGFWSASAVSDFDVMVTVKTKDGAACYNKRQTTQAVNGGCMLMTGKNAERALNNAFSDGIQKLFDDKDFINALLQSNGAPAEPPLHNENEKGEQ